MKVKELIERLNNCDQDTELFVRGYEGGWDEVNEIFEVQMILDANKEWYYGSNEVLEDGQNPPKGKKVVKGVIIKA